MLTERTVHLKTALERQAMSRPYTAHHELGSIGIVIITTTISTSQDNMSANQLTCCAEGI